MDAPSQSIAQEARQLNVRIEKEDDEWIAVLPAHPDLANDEELGLPAKTEQEALDEARAYRSIEASSVYKFDYSEERDIYTVSFGDQSFDGKLLAPTYAGAQKAYAAHINRPEPPAPEPAPPAQEKQTRKRRGNGKNQGHDATGRSIQGGEVTSGIGPGPAQLPPATHPIDPQLQRGGPPPQPEQAQLAQRITKLETEIEWINGALEQFARVLSERKGANR